MEVERSGQRVPCYEATEANIAVATGALLSGLFEICE